MKYVGCRSTISYQIAKFMGPTWGPPWSCRPQMGPVLAPWTFLSAMLLCTTLHWQQHNINRHLIHEMPLTLSQWSSSGNPVCMELRPQCTLECHWRNVSVLPVIFQWSSSGFPVVFQCVPIMQITTGSPLEHHWVLASASVVPVASQCTCGSSGLPVWSVQWYPSVLTESGLEVNRSGHFPACHP